MRNHSGSVETKVAPPTATCAVAARNRFLYTERKIPIVPALFGELRDFLWRMQS